MPHKRSPNALELRHIQRRARQHAKRNYYKDWFKKLSPMAAMAETPVKIESILPSAFETNRRKH